MTDVYGVWRRGEPLARVVVTHSELAERHITLVPAAGGRDGAAVQGTFHGLAPLHEEVVELLVRAGLDAGDVDIEPLRGV